jgi:hypothetical protein
MKKRTNPKGPDGKFLSMSPKRIARRKPKDPRGGARPNSGPKMDKLRRRFGVVWDLRTGKSVEFVCKRYKTNPDAIAQLLLKPVRFADCLPQEVLNQLQINETALTDVDQVVTSDSHEPRSTQELHGMVD